MLINLDINNYLLIQQATVHFQSGLTVVTGESGSGKSILIEALNRVFSGPINQTHALNPHEPILLSVTFQILPSHHLLVLVSSLLIQQAAAAAVTVQSPHKRLLI